jgi:serine/threonine protein kinase
VTTEQEPIINAERERVASIFADIQAQLKMHNINHSVYEEIGLDGDTLTLGKQSYNSRLGHGNNGSVFSTQNEEMVIKHLSLSVPEQDEQRFINSLVLELKVLSALNRSPEFCSPNVQYLELKQGAISAAPIAFFQKKIAGQSLKEKLDSCKKSTDHRDSYSEALSYLKATTTALDELHQVGFTHGDLHAENILIYETGKAALIDFGMSKEIDTPIHWKDICADGSVHTPKELRQQHSQGYYKPHNDLFSIGVLMLESFLKKEELQPEKTESLIRKLTDRVVDKKTARAIIKEHNLQDRWASFVPDNAKAPLEQLINLLLNEENPEQRPNTRFVRMCLNNLAQLTPTSKPVHHLTHLLKNESASNFTTRLTNALDDYEQQAKTKHISKLRLNRIQLVRKLIDTYETHCLSTKSMTLADLDHLRSTIAKIENAHTRQFSGFLNRFFHKTNRFGDALTNALSGFEAEHTDPNKKPHINLVNKFNQVITEHNKTNRDYFIKPSTMSSLSNNRAGLFSQPAGIYAQLLPEMHSAPGVFP